jgi:hypothetical protein
LLVPVPVAVGAAVFEEKEEEAAMPSVPEVLCPRLEED